ncbi:MAG TPA: ABC transporter ATP-binding protein [Xanthobacteraceae bacterium]|nr:ABC transporter ATP-binding protein [Xanthobacteraceae bacterium]HUN98672.1 ABC transporter ATP-binding protein [Bradyrhizobium sp.]
MAVARQEFALAVIAIDAQDIYVEFPLYGQRHRSLRNFIVPKALRARRTVATGAVGGAIEAELSGKVVIKAIDGLSFSLREGDRLGIIGHNGAGKTTLLRTLIGVYEPTRGRLSINGAVTPMFSLSDGMDQDATGYENIWLRSTVLGFSRGVIAEHIDDIAEFSELGGYLNMPIRTYSSGMLVRLGFAIATALDPQILIMDEMIGAGDAKFLSRAEARLKRMIERTGIMVVATHGTNILKTWCNKAMLLSHGKLVFLGGVDEALQRYEELSRAES